MSAGTPTRPQCEWRVAQENRAASAAMADALGLPRAIAHLLRLRGVTSPEAAGRFLEPTERDLTDPFLLNDMDRAVDRIGRARDAGEHVRVLGDYDVDGIAGTALLVQTLRRFGIAQCTYGMPNRLSEGYGIKAEHVENAHAEGVSLIITVDNGITACAAAAAARERGIDLIVTDHHQLGNELPDAYALINPKRQDADYPGADLAGVAVAFKLAWALTGEQTGLDLVALGTVADIVPLRGENRALVALGLTCAANTDRPGLHALARVAGIQLSGVRASNFAYHLGPRINAGGRLGNGHIALELLLTDSQQDATRLAAELNEANQERRAVENAIYEEALSMLEGSFRPEQRSVVLGSRAWHAGVIGIVASRIQNTHYRPVVLVAFDEDGVGRGSARSIDEFDVGQALAACEEHLVRSGGHTGAAGLTIHESDFEAFAQAFEEEAARRLPPGDLRPRLDIDAQVAFTEVDGRLIRTLDRLEPFGCENPAPMFCTYGVEVLPQSIRELRNNHMRLALKDGPKVLAAIGFQMADRLPEIRAARRVDAAFTPQFNTWRGETTVQLVLKDIRPSEGA